MASGHASGSAVVGVTIAFTILAVIAVALRLYVRLRLAHNAGLEDALITLGAITVIGLAVCTCLEVHYAIGKHQWTVGLLDTIAFLKTLWASIILYNVGLSATKVSILVQYLRIFPQRGFRIATYVVMAVVFIYFNWTFWSAIFTCVPVPGFWDLTIPVTEKKCLPSTALWFANAGVNIATDIAVTVLPLPMFSQLNIPKRPKIGLMLVFGLGGFVCIISVLRLVSLYAVTTHMDDQTYHNSLTAMWSAVEVNTGILCSCLPTLRALVVRIFPGIFSTYHRSHPSAYTRNGGGPQYINKDSVSREELGRQLDGRKGVAQRAFVMSHVRPGSLDVDMEDLEYSSREINVITTVHQEVMENGKSDHESTRDLIHKASFSE